jgi:OOP family OmpA-OmpF porin
MKNRFTPPSAQRLSTLAIAAALAAFAGIAGAQTAAPTGATGASSAAGTPQATPGYVSSADGRVVLSGSGQCVRSGSWTAANAADPCERVARAELPPPPVVVAPPPKLEPAPAPAPIAIAPVVVEPPRPVIQKLTLSTDVLFDFGKAELKDSGKQRLDQLVSEIKGADVDEIVAVGHADRIASEDYNQKLSEARAQAVKDYLAQQGAKSNVITAQGKGESQPVTGEGCKKLGAERAANKKLVDCLQPDRRVEIEVLGSRTVAGGAPAAGTGSSAPAGSGTTR